MASWPTDRITAIAHSDDLHISAFRADGTTYGTPTWIWSVVVDGDLYVRAYNGQSSRWYQSAMAQGAGLIQVAGDEDEVTFERGDPAMNDAINMAYRQKYASSSYLPPMLQARPVSATVRITRR